MKLNTIAVAALTLGLALTAHATTVDVTTYAFDNSTGGGSGADVGLSLTSGESFTVTTDASQIWHGAALGDGNYDMLTSNANGTGTTAYATWLPGIGTTDVGTLVADIDGDFRVIGAGTTTFSAWESGELYFHYADINYGDNSGSVLSTVTTASAVPEPANLAMLMAGLGLMGAVARRRASSQK